MVGFNNTFTTLIAAKVRLDAFLTSLDLLLGHCLDLGPIVGKDLVVVYGVLSWVKYRSLCSYILIRLFHLGDELADYLFCQSFLLVPNLCIEIDREDELRMIQNTLVDQWRLHYWCNHVFSLAHLGFLGIVLFLISSGFILLLDFLEFFNQVFLKTRALFGLLLEVFH